MRFEFGSPAQELQTPIQESGSDLRYLKTIS